MTTLLQLFSARNFTPWEGVLARASEVGFDGVEAFFGVFDDPVAFRAMADRFGLTIPTAHVPLEMISDDFEKALSICQTFGVSTAYGPFLMPEDRPRTVAETRALAARLADAQARFAEHGIGFGWHNHDFEFDALEDGSLPMEILLDEAPGISWEMDIGWIIRAGRDPLDWLDRHAPRITAVHLKDFAPGAETEGGWCDLGHGPTDFAPIFAKLKTLENLNVFVAEHDDPSDFDRFTGRWMESFRALSA